MAVSSPSELAEAANDRMWREHDLRFRGEAKGAIVNEDYSVIGRQKSRYIKTKVSERLAICYLDNEDPAKIRARKAVKRSLKSGRLVKDWGCSKCGWEDGMKGKSPVRMDRINGRWSGLTFHYEDFIKPLVGCWLCWDCHFWVH